MGLSSIQSPIFVSVSNERRGLFEARHILRLNSQLIAVKSLKGSWSYFENMDNNSVEMLIENLGNSLLQIKNTNFCSSRSIPHYLDEERQRKLKVARFVPRSISGRSIWIQQTCGDLAATIAAVQGSKEVKDILLVWMHPKNRAEMEISWPRSVKRFSVGFINLDPATLRVGLINEVLADLEENLASEISNYHSSIQDDAAKQIFEAQASKIIVTTVWPFAAIVLLLMKLTRRRAFIFS